MAFWQRLWCPYSVPFFLRLGLSLGVWSQVPTANASGTGPPPGHCWEHMSVWLCDRVGTAVLSIPGSWTLYQLAAVGWR